MKTVVPMFHTVYNSFEEGSNGRDYIGKHSSEDPYDSYLGTFKDSSFDPSAKIVLAYSKTLEGALWLEGMFQRVFGVVEDTQFANKAYQTTTKFHFRDTGPRSEEQIQKIRESNKKTFEENVEERKRRSEAVSGDRNPSRRFPETKEQKKRRIESVRNAWQNQELLLRHSQIQKEIQNNPETNKKRSESLRKSLNTPEEKERRRKESTGRRWYSNKEGKKKFCKDHPGEGWKLGRSWID